MFPIQSQSDHLKGQFRARMTAQQLRILTALAEDLSSVPSTHAVPHNSRHVVCYNFVTKTWMYAHLRVRHDPRTYNKDKLLKSGLRLAQLLMPVTQSLGR